jgi:PPOX class probable F420-dependent enzyme
MPDMSAQQIWDFLCAGTRTAHAGTTRPDGRPHVKPVWFVLDGRPGDFQLAFTTYADSVKGRGLRRDGQVAVSVDDAAPQHSFVIVEGTALVSDDRGQVRAAATRIGGHLAPMALPRVGCPVRVAGRGVALRAARRLRARW